MPARTTALRALILCRTEAAWSDAVLRNCIRQGQLSTRDAGLAATLCYGVMQNRALLDWYIDQLLTGRKKLQPVLRDILRIALYQLLFLDRIPDSAAVNEAVLQAKKQFSQREAGLVNAVLRRFLREKEQLQPPKDYAILYSHPAALVDLMKESVGKRLGTILAADNESPETCVVTNSLKLTPELLQAKLETAGVSVTVHPWLPGGFWLKKTGDLEQLSAFRDGLFQVQDAAARLSVEVLPLQAGMRVLDLCAAPGGKSMAAAMRMENRGEIIACDVHGGKLSQITDAAKRLGISIITTMENDASVLRTEWTGSFDAVIADVPCSGLGVIRKKPDIRYKDLKAMEELPALQQRILETAARYVRPGGSLLYSTCTILKRENGAVVQAFLSEHPEFYAELSALPDNLQQEQEHPGMLTLYQGIHDCDGFFLCCMRRKT